MNRINSFDVIIVGAGVIGTSVAYNLVSRGYEVALFDRGDIASGTSSKGDAVALISDKKAGIDTEMGYESIMLFKALAEEFDYDIEFRQKGSLYVCETEQELEVAGAYVKEQVADGYEIRMIDTNELKDIEPHLAHDLLGGIWTSVDASVNPYKLCFGFVEMAKKRGLKVFSYHDVKDIRLNHDGIEKSVITDRGIFNTRTIVNCAGAWAPFIGEMVDIKIPIQPRKGIILVSEQTFKVVNQKVHEYGYMMSKFEDIVFQRNVSRRVEKYNVAFAIEPTESNNILIGGHREFKGYDEFSEIEIIMAIAERALRFFPVIKDVNCIRSYAGVRPYIKDRLPIISAVQNIPGYYIAAGHEGDGISLSPITGKIMAQIISGEETGYNIDKLSFKRFAH